MTPERWRQVAAIYAALARKGGDRAAFVVSSCATMHLRSVREIDVDARQTPSPTHQRAAEAYVGNRETVRRCSPVTSASSCCILAEETRHPEARLSASGHDPPAPARDAG